MFGNSMGKGLWFYGLIEAYLKCGVFLGGRVGVAKCLIVAYTSGFYKDICMTKTLRSKFFCMTK